VITLENLEIEITPDAMKFIKEKKEADAVLLISYNEVIN